MSKQVTPEAGLAARLRECVANAVVGMSEEESLLVAREALAYVRDVLLTRERVAETIWRTETRGSTARGWTWEDEKMKTWDGGTLKPCACGADSWESLDDVDHDDGACEVYRCQVCKREIHIELPD